MGGSRGGLWPLKRSQWILETLTIVARVSLFTIIAHTAMMVRSRASKAIRRCAITLGQGTIDMASRIYYFNVTGTGEFPWDMLRYDRCWPADGDSVANMMYERGRDDPLKRRTVQMASNTPPTVGRWQSFMWRVVITDPYTQINMRGDNE